MILTEKRIQIIITILFILIISNIFFIRLISNKPLLIGEEPYYHLRAAQEILKNGFPEEDKLVYGWRTYFFNPYHLILAITAIILGVYSASILTPLVFGFGSLIFLYLILKKINFDLKPRLVFMAFYLLSPIFLYTIFISPYQGAAIFFQVAGLFCYLSQKKKTLPLSIIFFSIAAVFGPIHILISLLILGYHALQDKKKLPHFYLQIFIFSLIILLFYTPMIRKESFQFLQFSSPYLQNFITDFGAREGINIFALSLAILGFLRVWEKRKEFFLFVCFSLIGLTIFLGINRTYTNLIITFFASLGFIYLSRSHWKLQKLKTISIILILLGLFFSTNSYAIRLAESQPDMQLIQSLTWLQQNSHPEDLVFSGVQNSFWIQTIAKRTVLFDNLRKTQSFEEKRDIAESIFASYDLQKTRKFLEKYNIKHILITPNMANENNKDNQEDKNKKGLFYLLKNSETFKKVYHTQTNIRIYSVQDYNVEE